MMWGSMIVTKSRTRREVFVQLNWKGILAVEFSFKSILEDILKKKSIFEEDSYLLQFK
jgi:hypothetical protein